jgi:hypothetical protein
MGLQTSYLGTLTIPNGGTASNILASKSLRFATAMLFDCSQIAAFTAAISVQAAASESAVAGDMGGYQDGATAVTLTALKLNRWGIQGIGAIRLLSAGAEGGVRAVKVYAVMDA